MIEIVALCAAAYGFLAHSDARTADDERQKMKRRLLSEFANELNTFDESVCDGLNGFVRRAGFSGYVVELTDDGTIYTFNKEDGGRKEEACFMLDDDGVWVGTNNAWHPVDA